MNAPRFWRTKSGVLVLEVGRREVLNRRGFNEPKIDTARVPSGGRAGWLWVRNLTPANPAAKESTQ